MSIHTKIKMMVLAGYSDNKIQDELNLLLGYTY